MLKNKCDKHHVQWDFDGDCPRCAREAYEHKFESQVYRNAEEKHRRYINELRETIEAQNKEISSLEADKAELVEALFNLANQTKITEYNGHCFTAARSLIAKHSKPTTQ